VPNGEECEQEEEQWSDFAEGWRSSPSCAVGESWERCERVEECVDFVRVVVAVFYCVANSDEAKEKEEEEMENKEERDWLMEEEGELIDGCEGETLIRKRRIDKRNKSWMH
jgi:large-conductance mechanosensitive channel